MEESPRVSLRQKVEFLLQPQSYPDRPQSVETIETHFAWVFLSDRFVYKLKKPTRFQHMDFTSLESRADNCRLEVALNRRLAEEVYIGVVPLAIIGQKLRLEGDGLPIEWLVKMHRLPSARMLDEAARDGNVSAADLRRLLTKLATFYRKSERVSWDGPSYIEKLRRELRDYGHRLSRPDLGLRPPCVQRLIAAQRAFVEERAPALEERAAGGWIVDAHGDLRPEHICLVEPPQIIDCLEFSRELRLLDSAADVAILVLECDRMGHGALGRRILELYREKLEDPIPPELFRFYLSRRALIRAHLSAWHLIDENSRGNDSERWIRRANWYLEASQASICTALA